MLTDLLTRTCSITNRTPSASVDSYGNATETETTVETTCELQQRSRQEPGGQGEFSTADFLLILPAGTPIKTSSVVTIGSADYEVVGEAWAVWNPRQQVVSHIECTVRRAGGPA